MPASKLNIKKRLQNILYFAETLNDFASVRHVYLLSGGIAFNTLLCALPLLLVATSVIGIFWNESAASALIQQLLTEFLPPSEWSNKFILSSLSEVRAVFEFSSIAGYIGAFTLIWTASALVSSIRNALNVIFSLPSPRFFLLYKLKDLGITLFFSFLLLFVAALTPTITFATSIGVRILPLQLSVWLGGVTANIIAPVGTLLLMIALYTYLPNAKLSRNLRYRAAFLCTILLEIARYAFGWYLVNASSFGKIYGVYAILTAIAVWVYYASLIIMMSAVIALAAEHHGGFRTIIRGVSNI